MLHDKFLCNDEDAKNIMEQENKKNKEAESKAIEAAAERLAEILIAQVEFENCRPKPEDREIKHS